MKTEYIVDMVSVNHHSFDVFIPGQDDFESKVFNSKQEAIDWISEQKFGKYTITEVFNQNSK